MSAHAAVPAPSAASLRGPVCWRMAEIRATSVSTAADDGVVLDAPALRFWRGAAGSAWASACDGTVRDAGCGRADGTAGVAGCVMG